MPESTERAASPGAGADRINLSFIVLIVAVATLGGFMFGYDSGVINGTQDGLEAAFDLSALGTGMNVAAILLGCAVGAFVAGRLADLVGRRRVMLLAAVAFLISALWAGAADTSIHFILARFVGGLGVGAASILAPAYISEVTPAAIRGRLSSIQQIMIIFGLTGAFVANYALAATAYQLLTGSPVFPDSNPAVVISRHQSLAPPAPSTLRPELAAVDAARARRRPPRPPLHRNVRVRHTRAPRPQHTGTSCHLRPAASPASATAAAEACSATITGHGAPATNTPP